ncbi:MAG: hypothetical protein HY059_16280 [Proteobacteria bacterium]|nr:hypothetical protein [Pseudomonadota bacterium]
MRSRALAVALLLAVPAAAQGQRFDWLSRIDDELPAIEACVRDHPATPVGVAALRADGNARHLLLRDANALVWSCDFAAGRAVLRIEPDPASEGHRRPVFWLRQYGEPWAECWDAAAVRGRDGRLVGWYVVQNC